MRYLPSAHNHTIFVAIRGKNRACLGTRITCSDGENPASTQSQDDISSFDINLWFFKASSQAKAFARPNKRTCQTRTSTVSQSKKIFAYIKIPLQMPGSSNHNLSLFVRFLLCILVFINFPFNLINAFAN